ncbi:hypothetical protein D3C75_1112760 [compost metagenome]
MQRTALLFHNHPFGQLQVNADIKRTIIIDIGLKGITGAPLLFGRHNVRLVLA